MASSLAQVDNFDESELASRRPDADRQPSLGKASVPTECTERLRSLVQQSGGTKQVAIRSGVALSTLGSYLAGGEMKLSTAMQLCTACNTTLAWLVGDDTSPPTRKLGLLADEFASVRTPFSHDDASHAGLTIMFSIAWLGTQLGCVPEKLISLEVHGSAMEPTLRHGDLLLVDTSVSSVSSLALHVIEMEGELLVRRLERCLDGSTMVHTDNRQFPPYSISPDQRGGLKLVGQVVWKGSRAPL